LWFGFGLNLPFFLSSTSTSTSGIIAADITRPTGAGTVSATLLTTTPPRATPTLTTAGQPVRDALVVEVLPAGISGPEDIGTTGSAVAGLPSPDSDGGATSTPVSSFGIPTSSAPVATTAPPLPTAGPLDTPPSPTPTVEWGGGVAVGVGSGNGGGRVSPGPTPRPAVEAVPVFLTIEKIGIHRSPIVPVGIEKVLGPGGTTVMRWQARDWGAGFQPDNQGEVCKWGLLTLNGHNYWSAKAGIFAILNKVSPGDRIGLTTDKGVNCEYSVEWSRQYKPDDTSWLYDQSVLPSPSGEGEGGNLDSKAAYLNLYTCSPNFKERYVLRAKLV